MGLSYNANDYLHHSVSTCEILKMNYCLVNLKVMGKTRNVFSS
jgi:hypothetical protein